MQLITFNTRIAMMHRSPTSPSFQPLRTPQLRRVQIHRLPRGFTLFELLMVVLVVGIAAAILLPAVGNNLLSPRLRSAANVLAADIEFCSSECITRPGNPRAIVFDLTNNKYTVEDMGSGSAVAHPMDGQAFINDFATGRNSQLSGVTLTGITMGNGTLNVLTFDAYGRPTITADMAITLNYNGATITVTVQKGTGDVSISGG